MEQNKDNKPAENVKPVELINEPRRDAMQKLGRFAVYAAPFTVLALTQKADAASGHGPAKYHK